MIVLISVILFSLLLFSLLGNQHVPGREDIGGMALVTAPTSRPDRDGVMASPLKRLPTNAALPHISSIRVYSDNEFLIMDDSSRRNLEVVSNMREGGSQYTLLECVDFTKTAMGGRLLRNWLLFPLTDAALICARQDKITSLYLNKDLMNILEIINYMLL